MLPTLPMFLVLPALLRHGFAFWTALAVACVLTVVSLPSSCLAPPKTRDQLLMRLTQSPQRVRHRSVIRKPNAKNHPGTTNSNAILLDAASSRISRAAPGISCGQMRPRVQHLRLCRSCQEPLHNAILGRSRNGIALIEPLQRAMPCGLHCDVYLCSEPRETFPCSGKNQSVGRTRSGLSRKPRMAFVSGSALTCIKAFWPHSSQG